MKKYCFDYSRNVGFYEFLFFKVTIKTYIA